MPIRGDWPTVPQVLPDVVAAAGNVADTPLLAWGQASAVAVAVSPAPESADGLQPRAGTVDVSARYGVDLAELADRVGGERFTGRAGQVVVLDLPKAHAGSAPLPWDGLAPRILLVGVGDGTTRDMRRAGAGLARASRGLERVVSAVTLDDDASRAFVEGYLLAAYRPPRFGESSGRPPAEQLVLLGADTQSAVESASRAARATWLARDLTNMPSNVKDPQWLADRSQELARQAGLTAQVWGPRELSANGFAATLAVGGASTSPPHMVVVDYDPGSATRHVVLVGKGVTFDTGGLAVKPRTSMVSQKADMAGAGAVLAAVLAAAEEDLPVRVTAVYPLAENQLGADSYRAGDVVTAYSGRTIEVVNPDAEGRMLLAEGIAYARDRFSPDLIVDVATLTGAAAMALGGTHAALYATDEAAASDMAASAERTGERVWRLPLTEEYRRELDSQIADIKQGAPRSAAAGGGSILAALFLREFAGDTPWLHLDIAGTSSVAKDQHEYVEGATGFGARLLLDFLEHAAR